jgi:purine-nucleoside/S-methyl-5'-thioadenosine phosphorylase / adenosine deaminase
VPTKSAPSRVAPKDNIQILSAPGLAKIPWLVHGFSTRKGGYSRAFGGGSLNLGYTKGDAKAMVERNREALRTTLGTLDTKGKPWPLVTVRQVHSDLVHCIHGNPKDPPVGDGLVTDTPGLLLGIQTADCLPVILADVKRRAIGVFHAGWRGTVKRIVEKGLGEMQRWFKSSPGDIQAAIGPGIHNCCYEVGEEVRSQFESQFAYAADLFHEIKESDAVRERYPLLFLTARPPGHSELPRKLFLDLVEANRRQLVTLGVPVRNISVLPHCTSCRTDLLFSYRAENGNTGRMMGVAAIRRPK